MRHGRIPTLCTAPRRGARSGARTVPPRSGRRGADRGVRRKPGTGHRHRPERGRNHRRRTHRHGRRPRPRPGRHRRRPLPPHRLCAERHQPRQVPGAAADQRRLDLRCTDRRRHPRRDGRPPRHSPAQRLVRPGRQSRRTEEALDHAREAWRRALLERGLLPFLREALTDPTAAPDDDPARYVPRRTPSPESRIPTLGYTRPEFTSPDSGSSGSRPRYSSPDFTSPDYGGPDHRPD